ncbi:MAG: hypothetical protein H0W50_07100 [Parachlamydiaceae bacterium]|nr:hypothetical protein [Parachlamydiaceae bacterium]
MPGLAEVNSHHFLHEVKTSLTFSEFVLSAFKNQGNEGESLHSGKILSMIGKLVCADGVFEHFIIK